MRSARAGDPRASVLLLLALRPRQRSVRPKGRLRGKGRRREVPPGHPPKDGRVPREGRAGFRPPEGPDRAVRRPRVRYLHLEVTTRLPDARLPTSQPELPRVQPPRRVQLPLHRTEYVQPGAQLLSD